MKNKVWYLEVIDKGKELSTIILKRKWNRKTMKRNYGPYTMRTAKKEAQFWQEQKQKELKILKKRQ